jgi:hypothetical protein
LGVIASFPADEGIVKFNSNLINQSPWPNPSIAGGTTDLKEEARVPGKKSTWLLIGEFYSPFNLEGIML